MVVKYQGALHYQTGEPEFVFLDIDATEDDAEYRVKGKLKELLGRDLRVTGHVEMVEVTAAGTKVLAYKKCTKEGLQGKWENVWEQAMMPRSAPAGESKRPTVASSFLKIEAQAATARFLGAPIGQMSMAGVFLALGFVTGWCARRKSHGATSQAEKDWGGDESDLAPGRSKNIQAFYSATGGVH